MEIEIKLKYLNKETIIKKIKEVGFTLNKTVTVSDSYFSTKNSMSNTDSLYRIRNKNGKLEFTLKNGCVDNNGVWTRNEYNVSIDNYNNLVEILKSLNCNLVKENSSKRETWIKDNVSIDFMDYTKPASLSFMEIEGDSETSVNEIVSILGDSVKVVGEEIFEVFDNK